MEIKHTKDDVFEARPTLDFSDPARVRRMTLLVQGTQLEASRSGKWYGRIDEFVNYHLRYYRFIPSVAPWMVLNLPLWENKLMMAGQHRWAAARCLKGASDEPLLCTVTLHGVMRESQSRVCTRVPCGEKSESLCPEELAELAVQFISAYALWPEMGRAVSPQRVCGRWYSFQGRTKTPKTTDAILNFAT